MTWNNEIPSFESKDELYKYMLARLSETGETMPIVSESLGISPEDILIEYYRYGELSKQQQSDFWSNWEKVSSEAFINNNITTYVNAIALAYELKPPENVQDITTFIPKNADAPLWELESPEQYEIQKYTLKLIKEWQLIKENDTFWQSIFETYLLFFSLADKTLEKSTSPPIISVYNGMGKLGERDYTYLMYYISRNLTSYTQKLFFHICEDQSYRFFQDDEDSDEMEILLKNAWDTVLISSNTSKSTDDIYKMQDYLENNIDKIIISINVESVDAQNNDIDSSSLPLAKRSAQFFHEPDENPLPLKQAA